MAIAFSVAFTPTPLAATELLVVEATAAVSAGINFVPRSGYKKVFIGAAATASPANILAGYNAIYGALVAGTKIFVRARVIDNAKGFASTPQLSSIIVS